MISFQVRLTEEQDRFIAREVDEGRYENRDAVIGAALAALEYVELENAEKLAWLKAAIAEGDASGIAEGDVFARVRQEVGLPPERL